MKKTVLITGSRGYLGLYLVHDLLSRGQYNLVLFNEDVDTPGFTLPPADVVIHLAGKLNSFKGSSDALMTTNYLGTVHIAQQCAPDTHFIFLSSDYVFASDPHKIYTEADAPAPETAYGQSKAQAETFLLEAHPRCTILRTSMLYGYNHPRRKNFFKFAEETLQQGKSLDLFVDVYSCPTFIGDVCAFIHAAIQEQPLGIYHACGGEYVSRFELGKRICQARGFDPALIIDVKKPSEVIIPQYLHLRSSLLCEPFIVTSLEQGILHAYALP